MAYQKPQAMVYQQFETTSSPTAETLRACIVGPSAILHRYADSDEKIDIYVGIYDKSNDQTYSYPGIKAGGIVDTGYSKLYIDNALLAYFDSTVNRTVNTVAAKTETVSSTAYTVYQTTSATKTTINASDTNIVKPTAAGEYKCVFEQETDEDGNLLYVKSDGTTTTSTTDAAKYSTDGSTESTIPIPSYVLKKDGSGAQIYWSTEGVETNNTRFAATYTYDAETTANTDKKVIPLLTSSTVQRKKYKFYNDGNQENVIISDYFSFKDAIVSRSPELGIRDVAIGDYVEVSATTMIDGECVTVGPQLSRIIGFTELESVQYTENMEITQPADTTSAAASLSETVGSSDPTTTTTYCELVSGTSIDVVKYGIIKTSVTTSTDYNKLGCTYTIKASKVITEGNCTDTLWFDISSSSTGESRTVQVKSESDNILLSLNYGDAAIKVKSGQYSALVTAVKAGTAISWTYTQAETYNQMTDDNVTIGGLNSYTGPDDTYFIKCIEGAATDEITASAGPKVSITTLNGRENISSLTLTSDYFTGVKSLGTQGLTIQLSARSSEKTMVAGTIITFDVVASKAYRYNGIKLADDLIAGLQSTTTTANQLDVKLVYKDDIELPAISPANASTNWKQDTSTFTVYEGATTTDSQFIIVTYDDSGNIATTSNITLNLLGYGEYTDTEYTNFSKMYFNYREWSPVHASSCTLCEGISALDSIIGPLDIDNPLKWAVYKALTNSNGATVGYVAVKDPDDLDDWQDALDILEGRNDIYTIVPLTTDTTVQNLVVTLVNNESSAEACRWKTALFNMELPTQGKVIGANEGSKVTSYDGNDVICSFVANTLSTTGGFTKVTCTSGNARFLDYGVQSGDELRVITSQGDIVDVYTVDQVYSNGTLTVTSGPTTAETKRIVEIWHTYTRADEVALIKDRAQSFASRRIGLVWPDIVWEGSLETPGYYLSAALAGLKSGVDPENGLTRRTIQGFDDYSRSKPRYTESQLDDMASSGVWICVEDSDGTPQSRHALTTSTVSTFYSEEMMTRNFDSVSKYMYQIIDAYIGTSNVTNETLRSIYFSLRKACDYLIGKGQMIDYTNIEVKQHDLLLDRVVAYMNVGLPFAVNNVELYITAEAYKLDAITLESENE